RGPLVLEVRAVSGVELDRGDGDRVLAHVAFPRRAVACRRARWNRMRRGAGGKSARWPPAASPSLQTERSSSVSLRETRLASPWFAVSTLPKPCIAGDESPVFLVARDFDPGHSSGGRYAAS